MNRTQIIFLVMSALITVLVGGAQDFVYPVAAADNNNLYVLHQTTPDNITLLLWDSITHVATPMLHAGYCPASIALLPDGSGFSFIDCGRIRIKKWSKRSPKTIEFSEPIYTISNVQWLDTLSGFCCAKKRDRYGIFHITMRGDCCCIAGSMTYDCMYPQKIGSELFYIERTEHDGVYRYDVMQQPYPSYAYDVTDFNQSVGVEHRMEQFLSAIAQNAPSVPATIGSCILHFDVRPIVFLSMKSATEGFVLEHDSYIDQGAHTLRFTYHHLKKDHRTGLWSAQRLFDFGVPTCLIVADSDSRLRESLLPLVPRCYDDCIYFVDCVDTDSLSVYTYDTISGAIEQQVAAASGHYLFVPLRAGKRYFYGGTRGDGSTAPHYDHKLADIHIALPSL